jgi:membrane protease YdiL (CAAX protease family)
VSKIPKLAAVSPRTRARGTALGCALLLAALPFTAGRPVLTCLAAYLFILLLGRTRMPWANNVPYRPVVKLSIRVGVFALPAAWVGVPYWHWSWPGAAVACACGTVGLWLQRRELRIALSRQILRLQPHERADDRPGYAIYYTLGGPAQEYLYRGAWLAALYPWLRAGAIPVTALLFLAEHLAMPAAVMRWDRHDVIWQLAMSITLALVVIGTRSLPAAMLGHALYNSPNLLRVLLRPGPRPHPRKELSPWATPSSPSS